MSEVGSALSCTFCRTTIPKNIEIQKTDYLTPERFCAIPQDLQTVLQLKCGHMFHTKCIHLLNAVAFANNAQPMCPFDTCSSPILYPILTVPMPQDIQTFFLVIPTLTGPVKLLIHRNLTIPSGLQISGLAAFGSSTSTENSNSQNEFVGIPIDGRTETIHLDVYNDGSVSFIHKPQ